MKQDDGIPGLLLYLFCGFLLLYMGLRMVIEAAR